MTTFKPGDKVFYYFKADDTKPTLITTVTIEPHKGAYGKNLIGLKGFQESVPIENVKPYKELIHSLENKIS